MADRVHGVASPAAAIRCASARSGAVGSRVEVAELPGGVAMAQPPLPGRPAPVHQRAEIAALVAGAKDGEFDDFLD